MIDTNRIPLHSPFEPPRCPFSASAYGPIQSSTGATKDTESVQFSVVGFSQRRREIRELRRLAYGEAGKLGPGKEKANVTDSRDADSLIVIAERAGLMVASVRLSPPLPGPMFHRASRLREEGHWFPAEGEYAEASWACIHPEHQGRGLFWKLAAHMIVVGSKLDRRYLVAGSDAHLWNYWQRCGFRKTGATYRGAGSKHEYFLVLLDLPEVLAGRGIHSKFARELSSLLF